MNTNTRSKIMWVSGLAAVLGYASFAGYIPEDIEEPLKDFLSTFVPTAIFVFRGWFTGRE